jgi:two-component system chemotaxis response regulator CheY
MMERSSPVASQLGSTRCIAAKVLVVDDDQDFRTLARTILERAGMEVIEAEDGRRCIQLTSSLALDAIIVDMVMPHQDGIATLCLLKDRFPQAKIVAISGVHESSLYLGISAQLGASAILHKSEVESLAGVVHRLLED